MTEPTEGQWHLSKRISVETVVLMLLQTIAIVWFASKMDSRIENLEANQVTALTFVDRLAKVEAQVENLGKPGDVVTVSPGYARNYLLQRGFAYEATPGNLKRIGQEKTRLEASENERRDAAQQLSSKL